MVKVSLELGATINTGEYNNIRPMVRISDIDPAGDVAEQVADALRVAIEGIPLMDEQLAAVAEELISGQPNKDGLRAKIDRIERSAEANRKNVESIFNKMKADVLPALDAIVKRLEALEPKKGKKAGGDEEAV